MSKVTSRFMKLPPRTGIPFEGFEFALIKSRITVAHQLEDFLNQCSQSNSMCVALIRAEWGEGKTDAYERYLEPTITKIGGFAYLVSTSTIALQLEKIRETFPQGGTTASCFLAAVFAALKDELRSRNKDDTKILDYSEYRDPLEYVHEVLNHHFQGREGKLFIFIDEFEEILNHPDAIQRLALSGIKELINGQLGIIHSGGRFSGRLHIIVAVTPYAYARMHDDRELLQIFGSFQSRLSVIDLPQIDRDEAFNFLMDLVRWSYNGSFPEPLPFRTTGILNSICSISQRNLRALVQLYVDLMTSASNENILKIIDANDFINAFLGKEITVFGELRPCIDGELIRRVEDILRSKTRGQHCIYLFRLLVGEHKPFSVSEILERLNLASEADVHALVEITNQELMKLGIPHGIVRLNPIKASSSVSEVLRELTSGNEILLYENRISLREFREMLVHKEFGKNGDFVERMYFPHDEVYLKDLFDISDADVAFLIKKIAHHFDETAKNRHFMISRTLADQVFPSPTWILIDFVSDRRKRAELWREAARVFPNRLWQLQDLVIDVLNQSTRVQIHAKDRGIYETRFILTGERSVSIRTCVHSTSIVTLADVKQLAETMSSKQAGLGIIIHTGEIDVDAGKMLSSQPQIVTIQIRRTRALQLMVLGLAKEKNLEIRNSTLVARLRDIFNEIDFERLIDKWTTRLREEGIIIDQLITLRGRSDKALADTLTYLINFLGESLTAQEILDKVTRLRSFTFYRQSTPFHPIDIESVEELESYLEDLVANGFLEKERNRFLVKRSRIEERILKILETRSMSIEALKNRFIIFSSNQMILEQVFLPILVRKGLITIEDHEVSLQNASLFLKSVINAFQKYNEKITQLRNSKWWSYAILCVSKEREDRIISIEEFDTYLRELYQPFSAGEINSSECLLQRANLLLNLINHFDQVLEKKVSMALNCGERIVRVALEKLKDIKYKVSFIVEEYNIYCEEYKYKITDVEEIITLEEIINKIIDLDKASLTKDEISEELKILRRRLPKGEKLPFFYSSEEENAHYFNMKVRKIQEQFETLENKIKEESDTCTEISKFIEDINEIRSKMRGKLAKYLVDSAYEVSSAHFSKVKEFQIKPLTATLTTSLTLDIMKQFFLSVRQTLSEYEIKITQALNDLDEILKLEKNIIDNSNKLKCKIDIIKNFFDLEDVIANKVNQILQSISETVQYYDEMVSKYKQKICDLNTIDDLNENSRNIIKTINKIQDTLFENEKKLIDVKNTCIEKLDVFLKDVNKIIQILSSSGLQIGYLNKTLNEIVNKAKSDLQALFEDKTLNYTWSKLWEELKELRERIYTESEKILTKVEFKVLYSIVTLSQKEKWFEIDNLIEIVNKDEKLDLREIYDGIRGLIRKGLLKEGVALSIEIPR